MFDEFVTIPRELDHQRFLATPLTVANADLDYAAYTASLEVIQVHSDGRWPTDAFTLDDDLELVTQHESDHRARRAFTFVLLDPSKTEALGCLYVNPLRDYLRRAEVAAALLDAIPAASAMVTFWLRQDQQETDLADAVVEAVNAWLLSDWPLDLHLFRALPAERSSCHAFRRSDLQPVRLALPGETRPYLWYRPAAAGDAAG